MQEESNLDVGGSRGCGLLAVYAVEDALDLARGELADVLRAINEGAEKHGEEHEMVIVHPNCTRA